MAEYTVDFKSDAVVAYQPQMRSDPFQTFFKSIGSYRWTSQRFLKQHIEAREKLELSLSIPLIEQAKIAAISLVSTFVQDVAFSAHDGQLKEYAIEHMTFDYFDSSEQPAIATMKTHMTMFQRFYYETSPGVLETAKRAWSVYNTWPSGAWESNLWNLEPIEVYGEEMPVHAVRMAAKLKEYGVFPHLGRFWVAYPDKRIDPILYVQILRRFVYLADWK